MALSVHELLARRSNTYNGAVAAVGFAGNIDPTPEVDVVDGISPTIALHGPRSRPANKGTAVDELGEGLSRKIENQQYRLN